MADALQAQIRARLDALAEELAELYRSAVREAVDQMLGGGGGNGRRGRRAKTVTRAAASGRKRGAGGRRSSEQIAALADKIAAHVKSHPGQGAEAIKSALGIAKNEWLRPIGMLVK